MINPPPSAGEKHELPLLEIIDLKWLLASEGVHLHVERLQADPTYAGEMLAVAALSANAALRAAAARIVRRLQPCA